MLPLPAFPRISLTGWLGIGAVLCLAFAAMQTVRIREAQADLRAAWAELAQYRAAYDALAASAQRQSAAVSDWQAQAAAAARRAATARAAASAASRTAEEMAERLRTHRAPPAGAECEVELGAVRGLLEEARR
jgi:chromosome segregation ATPase